MPPANRRRSAAKDHEPSQEEHEAAAAGTDDTGGGEPTDLPAASVGQDPQLPGDEGEGDGGGEAAEGALEDDSGAPMPKDVLIQLSESVLPGFDPILVRGVLADAPDPISAVDAKSRIERFLAAPVTTTEEA